jgi:hypothetical protein
MSRTWIRSTLGVVVIVVAVFATVGEGSTSKSSSGGSSSGTSAPASSQSSPIPIGTSATVAKGWDVKVNSAKTDANADMAAANQFNKPAPGTQYVTVNASITNNSDKPDVPWTNVKFSLLPKSGVGISTTFVAGVSTEISETAQRPPGAPAPGLLIFEVPTADVPGAVLLGEPVLTLDTAKDQKFFAIQ